MKGYIHLDRIPLEVGMNAIKNNLQEKEKAFRVQVGSHEVHVTSLRLRTFYADGAKCYICAKEATHFSADLFSNRPSNQRQIAHMNMWGVDEDGEELLFTHDHVLARSLGGGDHLGNTKTCCTKCNNQKSFGENKLLAEMKARRML